MVKKLIANLDKILIGKGDVTRDVVIALISGGNVLIEDIPGVGKTTLAKGLSKLVGGRFNRIQFTPDLMPLDILGVSIYNPKTSEFELKEGPIMANIILADEINRSSPKTQSSLLEAMGEKQFTVDGKTIRLQEPFMVIATQNPIEFEGTYPLPESQLDRFMLRLKIGYPDEKHEMDLLGSYSPDYQSENALSLENIEAMKKEVDKIYVKDTVKRFIVEIVSATRNDTNIVLGASPRASIDLYKASKALAYINGREFVIPSDVIELATKVLSHRIKLTNDLKYRNVSESEYFAERLKGIKVNVNEDFDKKQI